MRHLLAKCVLSVFCFRIFTPLLRRIRVSISSHWIFPRSTAGISIPSRKWWNAVVSGYGIPFTRWVKICKSSSVPVRFCFVHKYRTRQLHTCFKLKVLHVPTSCPPRVDFTVSCQFVKGQCTLALKPWMCRLTIFPLLIVPVAVEWTHDSILIYTRYKYMCIMWTSH